MSKVTFAARRLVRLAQDSTLKFFKTVKLETSRLVIWVLERYNPVSVDAALPSPVKVVRGVLDIVMVSSELHPVTSTLVMPPDAEQFRAVNSFNPLTSKEVKVFAPEFIATVVKFLQPLTFADAICVLKAVEI